MDTEQEKKNENRSNLYIKYFQKKKVSLKRNEKEVRTQLFFDRS